MADPLEAAFTRLRELLVTHATQLTVGEDSARRYSLEAEIGPATLTAWRGRVRKPRIPVAWVERRAASVALHLMGLEGNASLGAALSEPLRKRLQGKTCFHFTTVDDALFDELQHVVAEAISGMLRAGYIVR